jgi:hypothetical protein
MTVNDNMTITGIHYASKYYAGSALGTIDLQIKDYSGLSGVSG